ncbi:siderophore-interacting protein [Mycobacterium sp. NPDC050041]|uniref:siderophore-interacting protein n=1 Tax=Mycobacterium sp. NPDC050041 TaxID=3364293 RepID=UPI003C2C1293
MADQKATRGWQGTVLKLFRAGDHEFTVTGKRQVGPHYLRVSFTAGGMLAGRPTHPTQWVRMWFADGERLHQRGYTLVDPDPEADTVDVEFALHEGIASQWAEDAEPGDTIEVTVLGSNFALPEPRPAGYVIVGDTASLPAINSLLDAIGDAPARVFLEAGHADDRELPVARAVDITWVDRENAGAGLVDAVTSSAFDATDHFGWVASDNRTTRAVAKVLREEYRIPRKSIKAQAYWVA